MAFFRQVFNYLGRLVYWLLDKHFGKVFSICVCLIFVIISAPIICRVSSKPRPSEAKIALSALYGEQKAYFSEYSHYHDRPMEMEFLQDTKLSHYIIGVPFECAKLAGYKETEAYHVAGRSPSSLLQEHKDEALAYLRSINPKYYPCPEPADGFELYAVGKLDPSQPLDVWKIDQNKNLVNVQSGYKPE